MNFNNDEDIITPQNVTGGKRPIKSGKTSTKIIKNPEAPLEESRFKVMLEIAGSGPVTDRPGVDLVAVLDVSGSMAGQKLEKLKEAMRFMIRKLSPIDRLSVITFSDGYKLICPLRQITDKSKPEIERLVDALGPEGSTNIAAGLEAALNVLRGRRITYGRAAGIMLMSDGGQNIGDATKVPVGTVPVHTFGFGVNHDSNVLSAIAHNSREGTFADVHKEENLSKAFSQCLGGLLTVAVQDLNLKLTRLQSTIQKVSAGNYPQSWDNSAGSVTVSFGNIYIKELRTVIVDLLLPAVPARAGADILEISYAYSTNGEKFSANPIIVNINRAGTAPIREREEVIVEEGRIQTAEMMKEARVLADEKKLKDAVDKLIDALIQLDGIDADQSNSIIKMLRLELENLKEYMQSEDVYNAKGRAYALASEMSHARQRHAVRGDRVEDSQMFATPRMTEYLKQAESFEADPSKAIPSAEEDEKEEVAADPVTLVVGELRYQIQTALQAFQSIENVLNSLP